MTNSYPVTQADREASADWKHGGRSAISEHEAHYIKEIGSGKHDNLPIVQAFAKHRCEALEQAAAVAEQYPTPMNDLPMALAMRSVAAAILTLRNQGTDNGN